MSGLTLPGDIEGLRRAGTPLVVVSGISKGAVGSQVVTDGPPVPGVVHMANEHATWDEVPTSVEVDLTDPTGRVHAAWWALAADDVLIARGDGSSPTDFASRFLLEQMTTGAPMTPDQITALRDLCLRLAGREVTP